MLLADHKFTAPTLTHSSTIGRESILTWVPAEIFVWGRGESKKGPHHGEKVAKQPYYCPPLRAPMHPYWGIVKQLIYLSIN